MLGKRVESKERGRGVNNRVELLYKKADITSVYTDEDYRCRGIQNVLMKKILDFLEEIECTKIELDATNPCAIKLYEKFGFKKHDEKYILHF